MALPQRDVDSRSCKLRAELDTVVAEQQRRRRPELVDPSLILRGRMTGMMMEEDWERLGLTLLASDEDKTLILFASSNGLQSFRDRLQTYAQGTPPRQAGHPITASSPALRRSARWSRAIVSGSGCARKS